MKWWPIFEARTSAERAESELLFPIKKGTSSFVFWYKEERVEFTLTNGAVSSNGPNSRSGSEQPSSNRSTDVTTDTHSTGNSEAVHSTPHVLPSGVSLSEGVKLVFESVESPLVIWIEESDGSAHETTLELTLEDLATIEPLLKVASEFCITGAGGDSWLGFKNVELDTETSVPDLVLVAEAMGLSSSDKADLYIAPGFGVCLISRPVAGATKWLDLYDP